MASVRNWPRIVTYLSAVALLLLLVQYFLGLWTNVYAPSQFSSFDSGANYSPSLNVHIINGDLLFLVSVALLVLAALSRQLRLIAPAAALVVSIYVAGALGMAYVNSTPNDPIDSFGMGAMFLVALFAAAVLLMMSVRVQRAAKAAPAPIVGSRVA
jgi:heme A synthase